MTASLIRRGNSGANSKDVRSAASMAGLLPRAGYRHFDRVCPTKVAFLPTYRERKQQKREVNKNSWHQSGTSSHPKHNDLARFCRRQSTRRCSWLTVEYLVYTFFLLPVGLSQLRCQVNNKRKVGSHANSRTCSHGNNKRPSWSDD